MAETKLQKKLRVIWPVLNSNFGLFIMGSVVLAGISNCVSSSIQNRQAKIENRREAIRYLTEFEYRLTMFKVNYNDRQIWEEHMLDDEPLPGTKSSDWSNRRSRAVTQEEILIQTGKDISKGYDAIIAGAAPYIPTEKMFEQRHILSLISWFKYAFEKKIEIENEVESVNALVRKENFGTSRGDSIFNSHFKILSHFTEKVKSALDK